MYGKCPFDVLSVGDLVQIDKTGMCKAPSNGNICSYVTILELTPPAYFRINLADCNNMWLSTDMILQHNNIHYIKFYGCA